MIKRQINLVLIIKMLLVTLGLAGCLSNVDDSEECSFVNTNRGDFITPARYSVIDQKAQPVESILIVSAPNSTYFQFEKITGNGSVISTLNETAEDGCMVFRTDNWVPELFVFNQLNVDEIGQYVFSDSDVSSVTSNRVCEEIRNEVDLADNKCTTQVTYSNGEQLTISVDNGISSFAGVDKAKSLGIKVLVTDHHLAAGPLESDLPNADAIVNPNQPNCAFPSKAACGCAVIFYVMCALKSRLNKQDVNMAGYLDLVALATVADVVPLDENNRILVEQGLRRIRKGHGRLGIQALLKVSQKIPERLTSKDFGFALGPRLNAAGRLDDMSIGIECLLAKDFSRAISIAETLDELNQDRKSVEAGMQQEALAQLEKINLDEVKLPSAITLFNPQWHQGVVGLLASRIKERFYRPVIAFAPAEEGNENGELKGSGRSIPGFHMRDGLDLVAKRIPHVLNKFGGHAMAAGLSIKAKDLPEFERTFAQVVDEQLSEDDLQQVIHTDGPLGSQEFNLDMAHQLRFVAPWGQNFPEPLFDGEFDLVNQRIVGEKHLKLTVREPQSGQFIDAIAFNVDVKQWPNNAAQKVHLVYELDANFFRNEWSLQLMVRHIFPA